VHPEDRPRAAEAAAAALQGGPHYDIEYRVIQPSGDMRIVHSRGEVMWDESGQPLRMFGIMHDITQLRQAEQEHRDSEARFRVFVDHAADGFFLHDEDGNVLDVNRRACESMGYSREELIRMSPREFDVDMDDSFLGEMRERLDAGEVVTINTRHRRKDGSVFPVEVRARPFWVGNQRYGVSLVRDVTERLQAEAALRQRESQLQLVIDTVPEGVILLDATGMMYLTNPVADQYLEILDPDREAGHITHLGQRALKEFLTSPPEGLWHEIAYEAHIYEAIARPVENTIRNSGWVLVLRDITRERDIQRRVQRQERLAAVGQLAAGIAHDFNNILAVIKLYAQFISKTVEMPSRAHERLTTIEQQVGQASALIQQILDFSRLSVLERRPLNLLPFLEELVTLLGRTLPEHIQVEFAHTVGPHLIRADPTRLQQVMMNLAVNARDSMPEGGRLVIRLTHMHTEERKSMCIQDLPPGDWVLVEVTDSGGGIPAEVLNHIFEPFFTTKEVGEGTGLGLSQVYGIVQQHEGYVDVITGIGNGTSFLLYFPVLRSNEMVTGVSAGASVQLGQGQKVLLVEDNPIMREALLDSLKLLNYEVVAASNGREALAILETMAEEITLVLSDVVMPVMGGTALFYAIRDKDLDIPVVLLTGHPLAKEMDELQSIGLAGWLPKPPDLQTLSSLLEKIVPR
jgi:PAS domain S-box-containing protein